MMNVTWEWLGENWELLCIFFGVAVNALGLLYNVWRYVRAGGLRNTDIWQELLAAARKYECEAEAAGGLSGAEKLEYVLSRMREHTELLGYRYDREELAAMVEKDIAFANTLNDIKSERLE